MRVDLKGLASALDDIREELPPYENEVDHRHGILYTAAECLRQAGDLESALTAIAHAIDRDRRDKLGLRDSLLEVRRVLREEGVIE